MKAILEKIPHEEWDAAVQKISFRLWPMFGIAVAMAITAACILFFVAPAAIGTERLDQQGDPLPKGALIWLGNIRFRAEGYISSVAFSPDGRLVAAGDSEGLVYLWESATGKPVRRLDASDRGSVVLFSPTGDRLLARTANGNIRLWKIETGESIGSFRRPHASDQRRDIFLFTP